MEERAACWRSAPLEPATAKFDPAELHMHKIVGGYLVQQRDLAGVDEASLEGRHRSASPRRRSWPTCKLAWLACKHVKSNAIVLAKDGMLVGVGGGQVDRVGAAGIAIAKAGDRAKGAVAACDAFFPFPDGPQLLLEAGVTAIIHPGGSVRDQESIDAVNARRRGDGVHRSTSLSSLNAAFRSSFAGFCLTSYEASVVCTAHRGRARATNSAAPPPLLFQ